MNIWQLSINISRDSYEPVTAVLAQRQTGGWQETEADDKIVIDCFGDNKGHLENLLEQISTIDPDIQYEFQELENRDWHASWREFFTPVHCGNNFVVLPPWLANEEYREKYKIIIDPKSAFGTGHHASTVLCLKALDRLLEEGKTGKDRSFLDLGCGTGVLGIGAAQAGLKGICLDIDPLAIQNAEENSAHNGIATSLQIREGSVELVEGQRFDLVMANILANPLINMAHLISACLMEDACLILSGILTKQADDVIKAYKVCSLPEPDRYEEGEWTALVWSNLKKEKYNGNSDI